jgi:hypothetical protein
MDFSCPQVADDLSRNGVPTHRTTPRRWCIKHPGIGVRIGGRWRISKQAVEYIKRGLPLDEVAARVSGA